MLLLLPAHKCQSTASLHYFCRLLHRSAAAVTCIIVQSYTCTAHPGTLPVASESPCTCLGSACRAAAACLCAAFAASMASCSFVGPGVYLGGGLGFAAGGNGCGCGTGLGQGCDSLNSCGTVGPALLRLAGLLHAVRLLLPVLLAPSCKPGASRTCPSAASHAEEPKSTCGSTNCTKHRTPASMPPVASSVGILEHMPGPTCCSSCCWVQHTRAFSFARSASTSVRQDNRLAIVASTNCTPNTTA